MHRKIARRALISGLSAAAAAVTQTKKAEARTHAYPGFFDASPNNMFEPQKKCFMDQFYDGWMNIVRGVRDTQIGNISAAMEKAYEIKRKGGRIYSHIVYGHYSMFAGTKDRPGQPWVLPQCGLGTLQEELDSMKEGDFLITNRVCEKTYEAHNRGVYVVGVTNNYFKFYKTPPDGLSKRVFIDDREIGIEDVSDIVIDSHVPWDNGLVSAPQVPNFKLCASSGMTQFLVYWACTASLANLIGTKGKGSSAEPAEKYIDLVHTYSQMIRNDRPKIDWVAEKWMDLVLINRARLLLYGQPQGGETYGGTHNMFVNDAVECSSSSMIALPYVNFDDDLKPTDIVLIGGITSNNEKEITVARHARATGCYSVTFCPYGTDGDTSGVRLYKEVDDAFNTYCDASAGVIEIKGFKEKVSPVCGLTGNLIHWMLTAQWTDHMARRGEMPYFWQGYHETGGREYDKMVHPFFLERGY